MGPDPIVKSGSVCGQVLLANICKFFPPWVFSEDMLDSLATVGCDAGGIYGDSYPNYEGLTLSFAFNSGRLAGYAAATSLSQTK
jgi:hypothetical protein